MKLLNELEPLDLDNRTIIKCINTQVIGQIRYYIGSVIFTVGCMESVDIIIRRWLKNKDYIHINQNVHRLYLKENVLGSGLISARDLQLNTLLKLYLEEKEREVDDIFRKLNEMLEDKKNSKALLNKIKLHQDYLNDNEFMNIIKSDIIEQNI